MGTVYKQSFNNFIVVRVQIYSSCNNVVRVQIYSSCNKCTPQVLNCIFTLVPKSVESLVLLNELDSRVVLVSRQ
jgi:hypothetical protein